MICLTCSTDNSERRKYCRECGSLIVRFCQKCGFQNSPDDKYCGGCGTSLAVGETAAPGEREHEPSAPSTKKDGAYSMDDIHQLIGSQSQKKEKKPKKSETKDAGQVSQDFLDSMFETDDGG